MIQYYEKAINERDFPFPKNLYSFILTQRMNDINKIFIAKIAHILYDITYFGNRIRRVYLVGKDTSEPGIIAYFLVRNRFIPKEIL